MSFLVLVYLEIHFLQSNICYAHLKEKVIACVDQELFSQYDLEYIRIYGHAVQFFFFFSESILQFLVNVVHTMLVPYGIIESYIQITSLFNCYEKWGF